MDTFHHNTTDIRMKLPDTRLCMWHRTSTTQTGRRAAPKTVMEGGRWVGDEVALPRAAQVVAQSMVDRMHPRANRYEFFYFALRGQIRDKVRTIRCDNEIRYRGIRGGGDSND